MNARFAFVCRLMLVVGLALGCSAAFGQQVVAPVVPGPAAAPAAAPAPAKAAEPAIPLPLAPLATQLGQTIQTLVGAGTAAPAPEAGVDEDANGQIADTFATRLLDTLGGRLDWLKAHSANLSALASAPADFMDWLRRQSSDQRRQELWGDVGNDLLIVVGSSLLIGAALSLLLFPLRSKLRRGHPDSLVGRLGLLFGLFFLRLAPVLVFLGVSLLLLDQNEPHRLPRFVVLNVIYALSLGYAIHHSLRALFAPNTEQLRLFPLSTRQAVYANRWLSAFSFVIIYGYFFIDVAAALRIPTSFVSAFQNLFALLLTAMAIVVIFHTRATVAALLRGTPPEQGRTFVQSLRMALARHWHSLTTAYLVIGLIGITLLGVATGLALMLRGTILTLAILAATRFGFVAIDRWSASRDGRPALLHRQILSFLLRPAAVITAAFALAATWGFNVGGLLATSTGQRLFTGLLTVALTVAVLVAVFELLNASIEGYLSRRDPQTKQPVASARAHTLLPMVRSSFFILFCVVTVLTGLTAVGVDTSALLAGAGILGVALGFGSQTLVKDFLTGLFIVIENTISVGDVVKIDSFSGQVEEMSIRTLRLRDFDGTLHILPFSEVTKLTNMSRGFSYAVVDVGVAYDTDLIKAMAAVTAAGAQVQEDPVFKRVILEPIEVQGVEELGSSSVVIRARLRTRPGKQWDVRRLLLLRIKQKFDEEKIVIPYPTVTHITKKEKD